MAANRKHHAIDTATAERWKLLGRLLFKRRVELGYRYRPAFAEARLPRTAQGNLMIRAVNAIENGERPGTYTDGTMAMYARAYEITEESMYAVLEGEADKLDPALPEPARMLPAAPPANLLREDAARPYFVPVYDRVLELADQGNPDPTGTQLGLPPDLADVWDATAGRMSRGDRAWTVAEVQRRDAARREAGNADTA